MMRTRHLFVLIAFLVFLAPPTAHAQEFALTLSPASSAATPITVHPGDMLIFHGTVTSDHFPGDDPILITGRSFSVPSFLSLTDAGFNSHFNGQFVEEGSPASGELF